MLFKNKRKHPRAESRMRLSLSCESGLFEGTMLNISLCGMFAACEDPPPVGTMVEIEFQLPGGPLKTVTKGKVVRTVEANPPPRGIGVEFTDLDDQAVKLISSYVARCQVSQR